MQLGSWSRGDLWVSEPWLTPRANRLPIALYSCHSANSDSKPIVPIVSLYHVSFFLFFFFRAQQFIISPFELIIWDFQASHRSRFRFHDPVAGRETHHRGWTGARYEARRLHRYVDFHPKSNQMLKWTHFLVSVTYEHSFHLLASSRELGSRIIANTLSGFCDFWVYLFIYFPFFNCRKQLPSPPP